jgi:hypothetical protein
MLTFQPFFISGIEDAATAKTSAIGAMCMFAITMILSVYNIYNASPDKDDLEIESAEGYQLNNGATDYGTRRLD